MNRKLALIGKNDLERESRLRLQVEIRLPRRKTKKECSLRGGCDQTKRQNFTSAMRASAAASLRIPACWRQADANRKTKIVFFFETAAADAFEEPRFRRSVEDERQALETVSG